MRNILDRLIIVRYQQDIPHLFPPLSVQVCAVEVVGTALARNARVRDRRDRLAIALVLHHLSRFRGDPVTRQMDSKMDKS